VKIKFTASLLAIMLVVSGLLGFAGITVREAKAADPVKILVGGPVTAGTWSGWRGNRTGPPGTTVRYTVNITGVKELWAFEFTLAWGMSVLEFKARTKRITTMSTTYPDGILNWPNMQAGIETSTIEANRTAVYHLGWTQQSTAALWNWTSGTGCIVYLDFLVLSPPSGTVGECDVYFVDSKLSFKNGTSIAHTREDGYFYQSGKNRVPTASFTISPTTKIANKTSVTFNGGGSSDPDAGGGISSYIWRFGEDLPVGKPIIPAIESPHPYAPSDNLVYTLTHTNAIRMRIHFSNITTESGDYVRVRDKNDVQIIQYTGPFTDLWSPWVKGDTIKINLWADGDAGVGWGFKADHYLFFLQVTTVTPTYTYTILESDYPTTRYGPYYFTASLSVIDTENSQSKTVTNSFPVTHPRPVATFTFTPNVTHYYPAINWAYIFCGETVNFDASGSYDPDPGGGILWYAWDFGDGTKDNRSTPTTSYNFAKKGGVMSVGLTIKDTSDGLKNYWSYSIRVYNLTEYAQAYGSWGGIPPWTPADPNWNYFYDINNDNYITGTDLHIMGKSYY